MFIKPKCCHHKIRIHDSNITENRSSQVLSHAFSNGHRGAPQDPVEAAYGVRLNQICVSLFGGPYQLLSQSKTHFCSKSETDIKIICIGWNAAWGEQAFDRKDAGSLTLWKTASWWVIKWVWSGNKISKQPYVLIQIIAKKASSPHEKDRLHVNIGMFFLVVVDM